MLSKILITSFLAHLLGDFYLQSDSLAQKKRESFKALIFHAALYALPFLIAWLVLAEKNVTALLFSSFVIAHFLIDLIKMWIGRIEMLKRKIQRYSDAEAIIFLADQMLHTGSIFIFSFFYFNNGLIIEPIPWLASVTQSVQLPLFETARWSVLLLLIYKPANVLFSVMLKRYKPAQTPAESVRDDLRAGRMIGFLERILIALFLSAGQYASIGLIMTAKSIARYEKITRDSAFAEYYLIGTLTSVLIALLVHKLIFT